MRFGLEDMYNNGPMAATITVHSTTLLVIRKQLGFNIKLNVIIAESFVLIYLF